MRSFSILAFVLVAAICGLLLLPCSCVRDENQPSHESRIGHGSKTSLHVRGDGAQVMRPTHSAHREKQSVHANEKHSAHRGKHVVHERKPGDGDKGKDEGKADNKGSDAETSKDASKDEAAKEKNGTWTIDGHPIALLPRESFAESFHPGGSPAMVAMWMLAVFGGLAFILATIKKLLGGSPAAPTGPEEKQGKGVDAGSVLVCICRDDEDPAKVYEDQHSTEVLRTIEFAQTVTIVGKPIDIVGDLEKKGMWVQIEPKGLVALRHFKEEKAILIKGGSILTCKCPDGAAKVWRDAGSNVSVGSVNNGEKVVAMEGTAWCPHSGCAMVPVRPRGAVELDMFEFNDGEVPDAEAISEWAKEEMRIDIALEKKMKELRIQKNKLMMEEAVRKHKLEKIFSEMLTVQAEKDGHMKPTDDEIRRKAEKAIANADMAAQRNILTAVAYAAPLVDRSQQIYAHLEERINEVQEKGARMAIDESKKVLVELQSQVGFEGMEGVNMGVLDGINVPSTAAICASAFAPSQLGFLCSMNTVFLAMSAVFVVIDIVVLVVQWHTPCLSKPREDPPAGSPFSVWLDIWWTNAVQSRLYMWFLVDFFVHLFCVLVRSPVVSRLRKVLAKLDKPFEDSKDIDPLTALKLMYDFYMTDGACALIELDNVMASAAVFLTNWSIFFDTLWLLYGTDLVWSTPWVVCQTIGLVTLRLRVTAFQLFFVFYMLQLVMFFVGQLMASESFAVKLIVMADKYDEKHSFGLPIAKVLTHAFTVRRSSDLIAIQMNMQHIERVKAKKKRDEAEEALKKMQDEFDSAQAKMESLQKQKEEEGGRWANEEELQKQFEEMHGNIQAGTADFARQLAERSTKAAIDAEQRLDAWEQGEGGELIQAIGKGQGLAKAQEMLANVDTTELLAQVQQMKNHAEEDMRKLQATAEDQMHESLVHGQQQAALLAEDPAMQAAMATGAAQASAAAGAAAASSNAATPLLAAAPKAASIPAANRRPSQADEGAGGA